MSSKPGTTHPDVVDEFLHGIWWVSDDVGGMRDASLGECATEIQRLRAKLRKIEQAAWVQYEAHGAWSGLRDCLKEYK